MKILRLLSFFCCFLGCLLGSFVLLAQPDLGKLKEKYVQALNGNQAEAASRLALDIADRYRKVGDNGNAAFYYSEAIERFANYHDDETLGRCYNALAEISEQGVEYEAALLNYQRAAKHFRIAKNKPNFLKAQLAGINILVKQKAGKKALALLKDATNLAASVDSPPLIAQAYNLYSLAYEQAGNKEKALEYRKLFDEMNEKVREATLKEMENRMSEEQEKQSTVLSKKNKELKEKDKAIADIAEQQKAIEDRLTEDEQKIEQLNKEKRLQELEMQQKENEEKVILLVLAVVGVILLAIIVVSIFVYRAYQVKKRINSKLETQNAEIMFQKHEIEKQKHEIEHINQNLHDSIRYAERIQMANLPAKDEIDRAIPDNFILYKPKDVVSGDFYWFAVENTDTQPLIFFAVGDCTGHGVPGAFMAMIGITLLKEVVNQKHLHDPAKMLAYMHAGIRKALQQEGQANDDGVDIGICMLQKIDNIHTKIVFAGAKRPLYAVENGKFQVVKGDAKSVGGRQKEKERVFTNQTLTLEKGSMLYLTSDGYADQNNAANEKYSSAKLMENLTEISTLSVNTQRDILANNLKNHQAKQHQRDDITVVGLRVL
jgi:serine phosphatase RsbU (regulator of sigma subunit)